MKKVVYQITRKRYELVEVETLEQEELIKELNRDFEREEKRTKTMRTRCVSLDYLYEKEGFELVDNSKTGEELYFEKLEKELFSERLHLAINSLTPRQKEMVIMIYFENKTQTEVAIHYGISKAAVSRALDRIHNTLRKKLGKK